MWRVSVRVGRGGDGVRWSVGGWMYLIVIFEICRFEGCIDNLTRTRI
jgi:hypothetical protein